MSLFVKYIGSLLSMDFQTSEPRIVSRKLAVFNMWVTRVTIKLVPKRHVF